MVEAFFHRPDRTDKKKKNHISDRVGPCFLKYRHRTDIKKIIKLNSGTKLNLNVQNYTELH